MLDTSTGRKVAPFIDDLFDLLSPSPFADLLGKDYRHPADTINRDPFAPTAADMTAALNEEGDSLFDLLGYDPFDGDTFAVEEFAAPADDRGGIDRHDRHTDLVRAAERFAEQIAADMGIEPGCSTSLSSVLSLVDCYGGNAIECDDLTESFPGLHFPTLFGTGGCIAVASCLSAPAKATVTLHELVHRLLYSDAYEGFNEAQHVTNGWERKEFQEEVCRAVERVWVRHGGYDFRRQIRRHNSHNRRR